MEIKRHCGVVRSTGSRVYVLWRQLEDDPTGCLVIYRDSLPEAYAGKVIELVEGRGQSSIELWDVMDKIGVLDGQNMLSLLHKMGYIRKQNTLDIDIHIGGVNKIPLNILNDEINQSSTLTDGTVKNFNPFEKQQEVNYPEQNSIVGRLLTEAKQYSQLANENYERAYNLEPGLRPSSTVSHNENVFTVEFPADISQTKAIEILKNAIKERNSKG